MSLKLRILTPNRKLFDELMVDHVTLTGSEGQIQILPGHANMLGTLETGLFAYSEKGQEKRGFISTGFFEVCDNEVSVVGETLELATEIDRERAKQAESKAEEKLRDPNLPMDQIEKYRRKLERARARQV